MQLVFHRIKFTTCLGSVQTTHKDDWQLCDTADEARQQVLTLQNIHGDALDSWGIASITDSSEKSWIEK